MRITLKKEQCESSGPHEFSLVDETIHIVVVSFAFVWALLTLGEGSGFGCGDDFFARLLFGRDV